MAKKKVEANVPEVIDIAELVTRLTKEFDKEYGAGVFVPGCEALALDPMTIPISPALDTITGGIEEGSWVGITGNPKTGKCVPLDATVYTPYGPVAMGRLQRNDEVLTPDGGKAKIIGVFPQGMKDVYRVHFRNGDYVECCEDHLWEVKSWQKQQREILPLRVFKDDLYEKELTKRPQWSIRLPLDAAFEAQCVPIHPYVFGLLLGDGSFRGKYSLTFTTADQCLLKSMSALLRDYVVTSKAKYDYYIRHKNGGCPLIQTFKDIGLWGKSSRWKFIPHSYRYNTREIRLAVVQGLMDTDGYVDNRGACSFCTSSVQLAEHFKELIESLGGLCSIRDTVKWCNGKTFYAYTCHIASNNTADLFQLPRKRCRCRTRTKQPLERRIVRVEKCGKKPMQCIAIDAADGLFMTRHFVVTHNTTLALHIAAMCQRPENGDRVVIYDKVEGRLARNVLSGIKGLDLSENKFRILQSRPGHVLAAHEHLNGVAKCVREIPGCCVIIDSASALCDSGELNAEIGECTGIASGARLFSQFVRQMAQVVPVNRSIILVISHLISDIRTQRLAERSARAVQYQYDYMLRTIGKEAWVSGKDQLGLKIKWVCNTSKSSIPGLTADSYLRFGTGIDRLFEALALAIATGLVEQPGGGSWFNLVYLQDLVGKVPKYQGGEKVYQAMLENPEWVTLLEGKLKELAKISTGDEE